MPLIIGDVHGCLQELEELLSEVYFETKERVVFVGDLIDKGPDSLGVLKLVKSLCYFNLAVVVAGNHEDKWFRYLRALKEGRKDGPLRKEEWTDEMNDWGLDNFDWLSNLPLVYSFGTGYVVHAGFSFPIKLPKGRLGTASHANKRVLFTRYLRAGKFIPLGQEDESTPFWADVYDGSIGTIVYGHQPFEEVRITSNTVGVDTGCVYGGYLSAYDTETRRVFQVKAKKVYSKSKWYNYG